MFKNSVSLDKEFEKRNVVEKRHFSKTPQLFFSIFFPKKRCKETGRIDKKILKRQDRKLKKK